MSHRDEALLGVVIPVHNVEMFLGECLESIINQTYQNLEIVLVDDGSVDKSYEICKKYAESDKRILCCQFESSQGAIKARQKGTELLTAEYVTYVDSDDWLELDAFEKMMEAVLDSGADMVIPLGRFHEFVSRGEQTVTKDLIAQNVYRGDEVDEVRRKMILVDVWPMLVNRIYRKDVIFPYLLKADPNILINNDITCVLMCMMHIDSVVIIDGTFYHYRKNENSITNTYKSGYLKSNCLMYQYVKNEITAEKKEYLLQEWKQHFLNKLFLNIRTECSMQNKINLFQKMKNLRELYKTPVFEEFISENNSFNFEGRDAIMWKLLRKRKAWTLYLYLKANAVKCRLFA